MNELDPDNERFDPSRPIKRARQGAMLLGVCRGLARWLGWDATIVRLLFLLVMLLTAVLPCLIFYIVAYFIMPVED